MHDVIHCDVHGESTQAFVCIHLKDESYGLGFNREEPASDNPHPDAWCDACEVIRQDNNGWDNATDELCKIVVVCADCYERAQVRNTHPSVNLDDLADLRWKCATCYEWHTGPCLDFGYSEPYYWTDECEKKSRLSNLIPRFMRKANSTFLDSDFCSINGKDFFVRGVIHIPIIGAAESLRWGVWGSLSSENFATLLKMDNDPECVNLKPMFSWLSTESPVYENTLSLKMNAHIQEPGTRPHFWMERTDHPLARDFHQGITPQRLRELMFALLPEVES
jgi:hypothetical protein